MHLSARRVERKSPVKPRSDPGQSALILLRKGDGDVVRQSERQLVDVVSELPWEGVERRIVHD